MTKPHKDNDKDRFDVARDVLGGPVFDAVEGAFRRVEHAEEEIAVAKRRFPEHGERLQRSFLLLFPSEVLMSAAEKPYRLHCRELLERVAGGSNTRPRRTPSWSPSRSRRSSRCARSLPRRYLSGVCRMM